TGFLSRSMTPPKISRIIDILSRNLGTYSFTTQLPKGTNTLSQNHFNPSPTVLENGLSVSHNFPNDVVTGSKKDFNLLTNLAILLSIIDVSISGWTNGAISLTTPPPPPSTSGAPVP